MWRCHGLDWVAMALSFGAVWMLGNKRRLGFVLFAAANVTWVVVGVWAESVGITLGNVVFLASNVRGYLRWGAPELVPRDRPRPPR